MASNLTAFGLAEMLRCSVGLRRATRDAHTMESAARAACRFLYDELVDGEGERACALVRCYKTHPYGELEPSPRAFARTILNAPGVNVSPKLNCVTLLASVGSESAWNDRRASQDHRAIPLASRQMVEGAPMIAQLIKAFGVGLNELLETRDDVVRDLGGKTYGVFFVEEARES